MTSHVAPEKTSATTSVMVALLIKTCLAVDCSFQREQHITFKYWILIHSK